MSLAVAAREEYTHCMVVEANWGNFRAKFHGKEQKAFEWLCSLLFYKEHLHPTGALRYFNQAGIEADPIVVDDEVIGWQAKFINSDLARHKTELKKAIDNAKRENPTLTRIYFFLNVDFPPSSKRGVKDPAYKVEIEEHAKSKGVEIAWRGAHFFESPFVCEENANVAKHFFASGKGVIDFVQELSRHTDAILDPISSEIAFDGTTIKIDRSSIVTRLKDTLAKSPLVIVSGEAGVGKTAVVKDFFAEVKGVAPMFVFKATEFNITGVNQLFKDYGEFTLLDLINEYKYTPEKYIVIDSAEKLSDIERPEVFQEFLSTLRKNGWKMTFTTRLGYLDDLKYAFIQVYNVAFEPLNVPNLTEDELSALSERHKFAIPKNERLRGLLRNPFHLDEYLRIKPKGAVDISYADFKDAIWKARIAKSSYRKNNAHRRREECFLSIARERAASGRFFVTVEDSNEALQQLESDEIIKFDTNHGGHFVTHDIYEEWALDKIIERAFHASTDHEVFYQAIGSSLAIRRAFRSWISEKLAANDAEAIKLIDATVNGEHIERHWKDEVIVAVLLSEHARTFVDQFEEELLKVPEKVVEQGVSSKYVQSFLVHYKYEDRLLHKMLFLLRIACKEIDQNFLRMLGVSEDGAIALSTFITKPKGPGWHHVIEFINEHKEGLGLMYMHVILPALDDWTRCAKTGETTKAAGQIALFYYNELTKDDGHLPYGSRDETKERLIRTILNASGEIHEELRAIFDEVVTKKDTSHRGRYYELVSAALSDITESGIIAQNLPDEVMALANLFWFYTPPKKDGWFSDYRNDIEQYFDLASNHHDYYPASAFQTPTFRLLQVAPQKAVDFILAFTNKSVEYFAKSEFAEHEVHEVEVFMDDSGEPLKQYASGRLWALYRGGQAAPTLLESMHMALEKWLLMHAKTASPEVIESWCLYLLKNSRSVSITALVISVVLAEPSKLFNVARILFRTKDFFFYDTGRMQLDMTIRSIYAMSHDPGGIFTDERLKTCEDKHRRSSLEQLAFNYQLFREEDEDEEVAKQRQEAVWKILDDHYAQLPKKSKETENVKTWRLYLARMDRRKMNITTEDKDGKVLFNFNPEIDPELKKYSEDSLTKSSEAMKYTPLKLWARYRFERNEAEYKKYAQYEDDHKRVIADVQTVLDGLKNDASEEKTFSLFYHSVPPDASVVLLRDFYDRLNADERGLCKAIILDYASMPFKDGYKYQFSDGVDAAINTLPLLLKSFPEEAKKVKETLLFALFDSYPVGMSQRFSDYAVSAIVRNLWKEHPVDADSLFLGYVLLKPKFDKVQDEVREENRKKNTYNFSNSTVLERFVSKYEAEIAKVVANNVAYSDLPSFSNVHANTLVTAFQLIPLKTTDESHKTFVREISKLLAKRMSERDDDEERFDYVLRHRFLEKLASFVLTSAKEEIEGYVSPFLNGFLDFREGADFFSEFILAEDRLEQYDQFWTVWVLFYPKIVELCRAPHMRFHGSNVVHNYLLAWQYWNKQAKEWHSLRNREKAFFTKVASDIGGHPAVLYSLSKFLNEVGSGFADDGIVWISGIIEKSPDLAEKELEVNTVYHLENLVRSYALKNRYKIRTTPQLKKKMLHILNFLLTKGSVTAYVLREDIL